mgnify:CR=1 FL=1
MKTKIIDKVLINQNEQRVGVSFNIPIQYKKQLQQIADENKISVNSIITELLKSFLNDEVINENSYLERYEYLTSIIKECNILIDSDADIDDVGFDPHLKKAIAINEMNEISKFIQNQNEKEL